MVIASVPLWVIHPSSSSSSSSSSANKAGGTGVVPGTAALASGGGAPGTSSGAAAGAAPGAALAEAAAAARLLSPQNRAPIYGCDVHPSGGRFVTAGGDGKVKIWGMGIVLFGDANSEEAGDDDGQQRGHAENGGREDGEGGGGRHQSGRGRMARFDTAGRYVSSESSSGGNGSSNNNNSSSEGSAMEEEGGAGGGDDEGRRRRQQQQEEVQSQPPTSTGAADDAKDGAAADGGRGGGGKEGADAGIAGATEASNDASSLARKKKDGGGGGDDDDKVGSPPAATVAPDGGAGAVAAAIGAPTSAKPSDTTEAAPAPAAASTPAVTGAAPTVEATTASSNKAAPPMTAAPAPIMTVTGKDGKKRKRAVLLSTVPFDAAASNDDQDRQRQQQQQAGNADPSSPPRTTNNNVVSDVVGGRGSGGDGVEGLGPLGGAKRHKLLCTLSSHSGSVLSVRWACGGKYLASAGDDSLVLIYAKSNRSQHHAQTGNLLSADQTTPDVEHWSRVRICRGHNLDVVGLAWSPDDSHLVSCSLDSASPICVWRLNLDDNKSGGGGAMGSPARPGIGMGFGSPARHGGGGAASAILTPYKTLSAASAGGGHTSTVKGVAFDPTGKYLASSGDDPSVCIWRAYDDWGLEAKVDQKDGIFGTQANAAVGGPAAAANEEQQQLASLSLFRRISFSPDGAHVCVTNATVRGKSVASTVSRDGWRTACDKPIPMGAANLVGHRAAVVTSRHCPYFVDGRKLRKRPGGNGSSSSEEEESSEDENTEPRYGTLLALGDKRGFVTIWSTQSTRPIFKAQVSETRCTVTDLSWALMSSAAPGGTRGRNMVLLISLLDGHVAALRFSIPDELGVVLPESAKHKIFRLKYGINLRESLESGRMVDAGADKPRLIENALQLTMEEEEFGGGGADVTSSSSDEDEDEDAKVEDDKAAAALRREIDVRAAQSESNDGGKKRVKPVLMSAGSGPVSDDDDGRMSKLEGRLSGDDGGGDDQAKKKHKKGDAIDDALSGAARAAEAAEGLSRPDAASAGGKKARQDEGGEEKKDDSKGAAPSSAAARHQQPPQDQHNRRLAGVPMTSFGPIIPAPNQRVFSVDLPVLKASDELPLVDDMDADDDTSRRDKSIAPLVADCSNVSLANPSSGSGRAQGQVPSVNLTISQSGQAKYRDTILGATATAVCATESMLAVGTFDGTVYLYGTSPTTGWKSGLGFRCHAPLVMGGSVVRMHLREKEGTVEMLIVTANGDFSLYSLVPKATLLYRGTMLPPMEHMRLSSNDGGMHQNKNHGQQALPQLARITVTDSGRLLLLLSYATSSSSVGSSTIGSGRQRGGGASSVTSASLPGGNLQSFIYDRDMKLWVRVSDSRFAISDFYDDPLLPSGTSSRRQKGPLAKIESTTRAGLGRAGLTTSTLYRHGSTDGTSMLRGTVSRSHCEDRMACALALGSKQEFEYWLGSYTSRLAQEGSGTSLRLLVDLLLGKRTDGDAAMDDAVAEGNVEVADIGASCWWLSSAESILDLDRKLAVRKIVLPEMSKNRANQRLANEIAIELQAL